MSIQLGMTPIKFFISLMILVMVLVGCARGGSLLSVGASVPDLSAPDQDGTVHRLADYRDRTTVVYFYPKDSTPGCTKQACAFRDIWTEYEKAGVVVLGVSTDDVASKAAFAKEQRLPFPVLSDLEGRWVEAFGVPTTLGMAKRVTFLVRDGKVAKVYSEVDPGVHASEVLQDARSLAR